MERRLYEASLHGNVASLRELMQEDELILDRVSVTCFDETPLHIAAMRGHVDFTRALLRFKPKLAAELDYRRCSPLHLASAEGYVVIVRELLSICPDACVFRDQDGRTPLHLAAMKGREEVLEVLLHVRPEVTRITTDHGETIMHLCVKHNRLEALKMLVESESDDEFVNSKDDDGNTILHIAAAMKQMETIKYLLTRIGVKVNALNGNSFTALDVIEHSPRDLKIMEIRESLREAGTLRAKNLPQATLIDGSEISQAVRRNEVVAVAPPVVPQSGARDSSFKKSTNNRKEWFKNTNEALMVTATVIASIAFQAGINPPGGVSTENKLFINNEGTNITLHAGKAIMADKYPEDYLTFLGFNAASFIISSSIILFLLSGLPLKRRIFIGIQLVAMWVTITCMAVSYIFAIYAVSSNPNDQTLVDIIVYSIIHGSGQKLVSDKKNISARKVIFLVVIAWLGVLAIIFIWHAIRFGLWVLRKLRKFVLHLVFGRKKLRNSGHGNV
ncbi:hypothetical protein HHK36_014346 [Tetracentron sinense]|uniref:PGG domain-containing protein n=1 Tax=Tetracentron sinense TaxID=13715 RepID=A0A835DE57_TETSI|nr:hypothetical protein HHK36_014346 [Tetracentron sinense]